MPYLNIKEKLLEAKVVYYGAGLCGKTTNLEQIKEKAKGGKTGDLMSLNTDGDRTLFFDWIPFNVGKVNGCEVKLQLYTVPGQTKYAETRRRVLAGADGVVMVLDSQAGALDRNRQSVEDLFQHLEANHLDPKTTPIIVQLNKRDLPTAMEPEALLKELGLEGRPSVEAVAFQGEGVFETLRVAVREVLQSLRSAAGSSEGVESGERSNLDGHTLKRALEKNKSVPPPPATKTVTASGEDAGKSREPSQPRLRAVASSAGGAASAEPARPAVPRPAASPAPSPARPAPAAPRVERARPAASAAAAPACAAAAVARSVARPASSPKATPDSAPLTQLNEVIAGHRSLATRIDKLEAALTAHLDRSLSDVQRSLRQKSGDDTIGPRLDKLEASQREALEVMGGLRASLGDSGKRADGLAQTLGTLDGRVAAVARRVEGLGDGGDVGPRLEELAQTVRASLGALQQSLEAIGGDTEQTLSRTRELSARISANEAKHEEDTERLSAELAQVAEQQRQVAEQQSQVASQANQVLTEVRRLTGDITQSRLAVSEGFKSVATDLEERQRSLWSQVQGVAGEIKGAFEEESGQTLAALSQLESHLRRVREEQKAQSREVMSHSEKRFGALTTAVEQVQEKVRAVPAVAERLGLLDGLREELSDQHGSVASTLATILETAHGLRDSVASLADSGKKKSSWWGS